MNTNRTESQGAQDRYLTMRSIAALAYKRGARGYELAKD
jgi:hypothetical protein